jgi:hypothetical protein
MVREQESGRPMSRSKVREDRRSIMYGGGRAYLRTDAVFGESQ